MYLQIYQIYIFYKKKKKKQSLWSGKSNHMHAMQFFHLMMMAIDR